jgi:hypothetical protein
MVESPAYRTLSAGGHAIIGRIALEHMAHGGNCNGALPVTYNDFEEYSIRRRSIRAYLSEVTALGFVDRTRNGLKAYAGFEGAPAHYRLTWLPTHDGQAATNRWARFKTLEEASEAVRLARGDVDSQRLMKRAKPVTSRTFTEPLFKHGTE